MKRYTTDRLSTLIGMLAILALAVTATPAVAHHSPGHGGGPGGGGGEDPPPALDTGWVYYYGYTSTSRAIYRVSPDGATNEEVVGAPADYDAPQPRAGSVGVPSHERHDADRWYLARSLTNADIIFPNVGNSGASAVEIDAIREGDPTGLTLTSNHSSCLYVHTTPAWANDAAGTADQVVTWAGAQWADLDGDPLGDCEAFVEAGIFRAALQFDTNGAVVGMDPPTLAVAVPVDPNTMKPTLEYFSWAPDASAVAYTRGTTPTTTGGLRYAAAGSAIGSHLQLADGNFHQVDWSPDQDPATAGLQTTIAFTGWTSKGNYKGGVWSVLPDGSGQTLLAEAKQAKRSSQPSQVHYTPFWSPTGSHLAYIEYAYGGSLGAEGIRTVRRMAADGSDNAALQTESETQDIRVLLEWTNID